MILTFSCFLGSRNYSFSQISAGAFPTAPERKVSIPTSDDVTVVRGNLTGRGDSASSSLSSSSAAGNRGRTLGIGRGFTYAPATKNPYKRKREVERPAGATYTRENSQCEFF